MAVALSDLKLRFSVKTGGGGDTTAGTAAGSLGKYMSTTEITDSSLHSVFGLVDADENAAEEVVYRGIFLYNSHATDSYSDVVVWLTDAVAGGADIAIAVDGVAASIHDFETAQGDEIANENTAPSGESFSAPASKAAGLSLGTLTAGQCRQIWVRQTALNGAAVTNDGVSIQFEGDI